MMPSTRPLLTVALLAAQAPVALAQESTAFEQPAIAYAVQAPPPQSRLDRPARLRAQHVSLADGLSALQERSGVPLAFSPSLLPHEESVTCNCEEVTVRQALDILLSGTAFHYLEVGSQIVIRPILPRTSSPTARPSAPGAISFTSLVRSTGQSATRLPELPALPREPGAQEGVVTGVVVHAQTMRPIAGAQVVVEGTTTGTLADAAGRFRITGLRGTSVTLRVVMLGYQTITQTVRVGGPEVRVSMRESAIELDAVVVTGTPGGTRSRAIGNSVGQVSGAQITETAPVANVQQLLGGRVAGVSISQGSGTVGAGGSTRVRGVSSLSLSNEPLLYVDGVRVDNNPSAGPTGMRESRPYSRMNDFNPEDIESIEVIKGPAAATLYGTEASNGVIQIITKKGVAGRPRFDLTVKTGANYFRDPEERLNTNVRRNPQTGELVTWNGYLQEKALGNDIFQTGLAQSYVGSLSGGAERMRYFLSADYDNTEGMLSYNWQKMFRARANVNTTLSSTLDVDANFGFVRGDTRYGQAAAPYGIYDGLIFGHSDRQRNINGMEQRGWYTAPPEEIAEIDARSHIDRVTLGVQANWRAWPWLAQRLTVGADLGDEVNTRLFPRQPEGANHFFGQLGLGEKNLENVNTMYSTLDYSATATQQLFPALRSSTSVGFQYYSKSIATSSAFGRVFPSAAVRTIAGAAVTQGSDDKIENKTVGVFLQEQLELRDRVFLTAAVRADDNSAFGANYSTALYPKLSGTWVINEEPFWNVPFVDALKLRGAWGKAGQQPDVFAAIRLYQPTTGPNDAATFTPQNLGNPDLEPEKAEELELGFDAALLDNRVALKVTHYRQRTKDAIIAAAVAPSTGFQGNQFVNVGETSNRGMEYTLDAQAIRGERLSWDIGATVATNHSKVESLGDVPEFALNNYQEVRVGYPLGAYFVTRITHAELDAQGRPVNLMCEQASGPDLPCTESSPRVYFGPSVPTWEAALNSTLTLFSNLRLFVSVDGKGGFYRSSGDIGHPAILMGNSENVVGYLDGRPPNPFALAYASRASTWGNTLSTHKAGFAKLREVSATYNLPRAWASGFGASNATMTLAGRNLAILWYEQHSVYDRREVDPETRRPLAGGLVSYTQSTLPPMTQIVATLRVSF